MLELFGLMSIIDEHAFGDLKSFREQYQVPHAGRGLPIAAESAMADVHTDAAPPGDAVQSRYTKLMPMVEEFSPEDSEDALYELVSEYLRRDNLQALPASQRTLMTLVLRKLLASSTFAIAGALNTIAERLRKDLYGSQPETPLDEELDEDYEALDETAEEWGEDEPPPVLSEATRAAMEAEIRDLETFAELASSIRENGKGKALLTALDAAMKRMGNRGRVEGHHLHRIPAHPGYLLRIPSPIVHGTTALCCSRPPTRRAFRSIYADWRGPSWHGPHHWLAHR